VALALGAVSAGEAVALALGAVLAGGAPDGVAAGAAADGVDMAGDGRLASGLAMPQQAEATRLMAAIMEAAAAAAAAVAKAETTKGKGKPKGPLARITRHPACPAIKVRRLTEVVRSL
jgi:hypothetical protein